ncbi:Hypothetical predicted protein [Mytilus galloprovincialis]|uniref:Uncharacterized protein n=1 Tax=Mytilus galloprovincialis TaxID=29158 RepID=A0A8B6GEX0_MYTGA|nr:Hypothetical predicted protein [Mytilus galloprovincialis]
MQNTRKTDPVPESNSHHDSETAVKEIALPIQHSDKEDESSLMNKNNIKDLKMQTTRKTDSVTESNSDKDSETAAKEIALESHHSGKEDESSLMNKNIRKDLQVGN